MSLGNDRVARSNFRRYLTNRCELSYSTSSVYIWSLNTLSECLKDANILDCSIYDIKNIHNLLHLKTALSESSIFKNINKVCHGNLTPSLRHYYDFMASNPKSDHVSNKHVNVPFQRM